MESTPAIAFEGLGFAYDRARPVLAGVSASLAPGRVTAIVGPNGCGKSTLLSLALGLRRPEAGSVSLGSGVHPSDLPEPERAKLLVSIPQRSAPAFGFTALQTAAMGASRAPARTVADLARLALDRAGLSDRAADPVTQLSVGQQQRVALARALVQFEASGRVPAVLADEPVSAMDPLHALETLAILRSLAERGAAVGVVLHDLALAARTADDAIVLRAPTVDGASIAAQGPTDQILTPEVLGPVFGVGFETCSLPLTPTLHEPPLAARPAPSR